MSTRPSSRWTVPWWTVLRRLTAVAFLALLWLAAAPWFPWFRGSATATTSFGWLHLTDPLAALEITLASRSATAAVWGGVLLLLAVALVFGPIFCSFVCPLGLVLDLNQSVRRWLLPKKLHAGDTVRLPRAWRFGLLASCLAFSVIAGWPLFQSVSPINALAWALCFGVGSALWLLVGTVVVEWFAPRLWCRALCPLGALYSLVGRRGRFRVHIHPTLAGQTPCQQCTRRCPMGIRVMEDFSTAGKSWVDHPDCTRCGNCVDVCPRGVLRLGFRSFPPQTEPPRTTSSACTEASCEACQDADQSWRKAHSPAAAPNRSPRSGLSR